MAKNSLPTRTKKMVELPALQPNYSSAALSER